MHRTSPLTKLAILLIQFCTGSIAICMASIETISREYPNVSAALVLMVGTIPTLAAILVSLCSAIFYSKLGYRKTAIIAVLLVSLGGSIPAFVSGFYIILVSRLIVGIGYGLCAVLPQTMIGVYLRGDKSQSNFYGYGVAMLGIAGVVFGQLGGLLTNINIKLMWMLHLCFLLVLPVIIFGVSEPSQEMLNHLDAESADTSAGDSNIESSKSAVPAIFFFLLFLHFLIGTTNMTWYSNSSYVVAERGVMNAAAFSGTIVAAYNAGQMLGGFSVGRISRFTRSYSIVFGTSVGLIAFVITWLSGFRVLLLVAGLFAGYADAFQYSTAFAICGYMVPGRKNGFAVGLMNAAVQGGCFFGPYIPMYIASLSGGSHIMQMGIISIIALINMIVYSCILRTRQCKSLRDGYARL